MRKKPKRPLATDKEVEEFFGIFAKNPPQIDMEKVRAEAEQMGMVSDTPRTDGMIQPVPGKDCVTGDPIEVVHVDDCRHLEREIDRFLAHIRPSSAVLAGGKSLTLSYFGERDREAALRAFNELMNAAPKEDSSGLRLTEDAAPSVAARCPHGLRIENCGPCSA